MSTIGQDSSDILAASAEPLRTTTSNAPERLRDDPKGRVYLNAAATGWPRAPGVVEAVTEALTEIPTHPGRTVGRVEDVVTECRHRLASLLKVDDPARIVLTMHATHALNLAFAGVDLGQNAHVVTTVTEHNSVLRPINHLQQNRGVRVSVIGLDQTGSLDLDAFDRALADQPALVAINHASNVTGRLNDVASLFAKAKAAGALTLLDASQSIGAVDVHPVTLHADLVAFTGHKGLHGPPGTGALYVTPHLTLRQEFVGGTGVRSDLALHPAEMPTRLEAGTPNVPALAGLAAALRWLEQHGEPFRARQNQLAVHLRHELAKLPGVHLFDPRIAERRIGATSFCVDGWSVDEAGSVLEESFGIVCRTGLHCAPLIHAAIGSAPAGTIRFSVSGFNRDEDLEQGLAAVSQLTACALSK